MNKNDDEFNPFLPQRRGSQETDPLGFHEPRFPVTRPGPERQVESAVRLNMLIEYGHAVQAELGHQLLDQDTRRTATLMAKTLDYLSGVLASIQDSRARQAYEVSVLPQIVELHVRGQLGISYALSDLLRNIISNPIRPEPEVVKGFWQRVFGG